METKGYAVEEKNNDGSWELCTPIYGTADNAVEEYNRNNRCSECCDEFYEKHSKAGYIRMSMVYTSPLENKATQ